MWENFDFDFDIIGPRRSNEFLWTGPDKFHLLLKQIYIQNWTSLSLSCLGVAILSLFNELLAEWCFKQEQELIRSYALGKRRPSVQQMAPKQIRQFSFISYNHRYIWLSCVYSFLKLVSQTNMLVMMTLNLYLILSSIFGAFLVRFFKPGYLNFLYLSKNKEDDDGRRVTESTFIQ
ncbi:Oidioi.mRNA.OKI2018_I69.PAR.g9521.t1.cds [Oikopleura dioica]|uniref:Copper transport protein n=1 Tax=Oikopleura dioica TaxID=34765 RepID=A0ABN7RL15_OIKDI|nr:Oidioi.mRNA.OKI2018_I69.PAR.g9521.t1.cds [Oikopleura dioica]